MFMHLTERYRSDLSEPFPARPVWSPKNKRAA